MPARPQLVADDITPEALASLLVDQGGRMSVISAEGGIFDIIAGRYSGTPNLEVFLKGHAGDMLRVNRQGRDPQHIEAPALTHGPGGAALGVPRHRQGEGVRRDAACWPGSCTPCPAPWSAAAT